MITEFGRLCREIRMDHGELLYDMARRLHVSSAFLSKVENGKSKPPVNWKEDIAREYSLDAKTSKLLSKRIDEAREAEVINLKEFSTDDRDMMLKFARKLSDMDAESKRKFENLLR